MLVKVTLKRHNEKLAAVNISFWPSGSHNKVSKQYLLIIGFIKYQFNIRCLTLAFKMPVLAKVQLLPVGLEATPTQLGKGQLVRFKVGYSRIRNSHTSLNTFSKAVLSWYNAHNLHVTYYKTMLGIDGCLGQDARIFFYVNTWLFLPRSVKFSGGK